MDPVTERRLAAIRLAREIEVDPVQVLVIAKSFLEFLEAPTEEASA